jgi:predicted lipoprotein with Yx(FWY)xxD motif
MSARIAGSRGRLLLWILLAAGIAAGVVVIVMAMSSPRTNGNYSISNNTVTISESTLGAVGTVLVTDQGFALYTFPPDEQHGVTCTGRCALHWPPVIVPNGVALAAGHGVDAALLGTTSDGDGNHVVTYDGWPLYLYSGDVTSGTATGQGQYLDGGYWYVIRPDGTVVVPGS